jgi:hypothetical protein
MWATAMRRMRVYEVCFLILFIVVLLGAIVFALVLNMSQISLILLMIDFPIAGIVALFGSLSIREEEEEKAT